MIATQSNTHVQSTITGERTEMGIVQGGMAHILSILTDMYSNRVMAVVREYSTNARDAQVEAGFPGPIEVTLPTPLSPFFKVKDYGVGLGREDIREIYSQYGASTKRESNDFNGMLGIGCKSALTYTSQFTVVSVKDGQRTQVVVTRDQTGASMTVVDERPTDDANGTEVTVPAGKYDFGAFEQSAQEFFKWWPEGSVLVNGQPPRRFEGLKVTDDLYVIDGTQDYIIMGGVAYPADLDHALSYHHSVAAFVEIGAVNFAPSREALMDTPATEATIERIERDFAQAVDDAIQKAIDDEAETAAQAVRIAWKWAGMFNTTPSGDFTYEGEPLPHSIKGDFRSVPHSSHVLSRNSRVGSIGAAYWDRAVWLYGYDVDKEFSAAKKRKILQWLENDSGLIDPKNPSYPQTYILCDAKPDMTWLDPAMVHPWEDVAKQKLPRKQTRGGGSRISGSFDMWINGSYHKGVPVEDIDPDHEVFYYVGRWHEPSAYATLLTEHYDDGCTVVVMGSNREAKFKRNFPNVKTAVEGVHALFEQWKKSVSTDDLRALKVQDNWYACRTLRLIDPSKVDDPDLKKAVDLAGRNLTKLKEQRKLYSTLIGHLANPTTWENPLDKYPLLTGCTNMSDHVYRYINNEYAYQTEEV